MKKWVYSKLWIYFSFLILIISITLAAIAIIILSLLEYFNLLSVFDAFPFLRWLLPIIFSSIIGVTLSIIVSHYILKPISNLSYHVNKVIESDFSVQLNESHRVQEVTNLYRSFNIMVRELKGIEHFQDDFISIISHEFKTPLARIRGYAQLLEQDSLDEESKKKYRSYIIDSTQQLSILSQDILKLAKLDNQEITIEREVFSLDEQIRQAILSLQYKWESKGVQLQIFLQPVEYYGNANLLYQVWTNLFDNAIKFSPKNGKIDVYLVQDINQLIISIKDEGVGIEQEKISRIFERFYQVDRSRSSKGNGLGLAISKKIITLHNGDIKVESVIQEGSTFKVYLPINKISKDS